MLAQNKQQWQGKLPIIGWNLVQDHAYMCGKPSCWWTASRRRRRIVEACVVHADYVFYWRCKLDQRASMESHLTPSWREQLFQSHICMAFCRWDGICCTHFRTLKLSSWVMFSSSSGFLWRTSTTEKQLSSSLARMCSVVLVMGKLAVSVLRFSVMVSVCIFCFCDSFLCVCLQTGREDGGCAEVRSVSGPWHARHDQTAGPWNGPTDAVGVYWL